MGVDFDPINKYILITSPTTLLSALEIYNSAMDWCDDPATISYPVPMRAVGKFDMGGGVYSDSIFMLINEWKIKPYDGNYDLVITGTLLGEPGQSRWVSPDSGNVSIEFQVSSQATVIEPTLPDLSGIADEVWNLETRGIKVDKIHEDINKLPLDPASESMLKSHITAEVDDLITRPKGLDKIYDEFHNPDGVSIEEIRRLIGEIKGEGWTNETLKYVVELMEGMEVVVGPEKARFEI